jgi:tetratricopeptide (TPR) repeat protein
MGYAAALIELRRYQEARDWLTDAARVTPDDLQFPLALARLLAASPDGRVRNGEQAMAIVSELFKRSKSTEVGEAMAMAYAELGDYDKAAAIQRGVMAAARQSGLTRATERMAKNLTLYEHRQPCRTVTWD